MAFSWRYLANLDLRPNLPHLIVLFGHQFDSIIHDKSGLLHLNGRGSFIQIVVTEVIKTRLMTGIKFCNHIVYHINVDIFTISTHHYFGLVGSELHNIYNVGSLE